MTDQEGVINLCADCRILILRDFSVVSGLIIDNMTASIIDDHFHCIRLDEMCADLEYHQGNGDCPHETTVPTQ